MNRVPVANPGAPRFPSSSGSRRSRRSRSPRRLALPGCDADLKKVACDYPSYILNKIVRTKWLASAGGAGTFIKNFSWTNADQNEVADLMTNGNMSPEDAAKKWIDAHPDAWKAWIP